MTDDADLERLIMLAQGGLLARSIQATAALKVADFLDDEPLTPAALAAKAGMNADALARVLRLLASAGIFALRDGLVGHTPWSRLLRSDHPKSQRGYFALMGSKWSWGSVGALDHTIRTGEPGGVTFAPEGMFAYYAARPGEARMFNEGMVDKAKRDIAAILAAYDFSGAKRIADIGGGRGHLLRAALDAAPGAEGFLFDLPHVAADAAPHPRMTAVGGDVFKDALPAADLYVLMSFIHDFDDANAGAILAAVRRAAPKGARVAVMELLLPDEVEPAVALYLDVIMLAVVGGRERRRAEYEELLQSAGFGPLRVIPTASGLAILETNAV